MLLECEKLGDNEFFISWGGCTKSVGTPKSADWRVFASCYGVLTMPVVFEKFGCLSFDGTLGGNKLISLEERNCSMSLLEIIDLGMRSSISNIRLDHLDELNNKFIRHLTIRHPEVIVNTDLHTLDGKGLGIPKNPKLR